ncbi:hypothetical protein D5400_14225 [Georhizobium profundi]|uniref:Transcriptional regulator n=1 Tax=Georhizobium profundi TaxID=2341112 RepID=A0A3S9B5R1_9HYPH|nr:hypothetical protein [Georhizobium profundi]AZN72279.1 hypothetical protein D5400_14225 [Georhizobium profundi]
MAAIKKGITHRLADRMRLLDASGITVTRETLAGFENCSVALIARFENDAKAIARRASVRSVVR